MTQAQVLKLVAKWQRKFGLGDWNIETVFPEASFKDAANCEAAPEYKTAVIYFNLARIPEEDLVDYVRHELFHVHIWTLASIAYDMAGNDKVLQEQVRKAEEGCATALECMPLLREIDG